MPTHTGHPTIRQTLSPATCTKVVDGETCTEPAVRQVETAEWGQQLCEGHAESVAMAVAAMGETVISRPITVDEGADDS